MFRRRLRLAAVSIVATSMAIGGAATALADETDNATPASQAEEVATYWTSERIATAEPRDLVIDGRGLAYTRTPNGTLTPHGHDRAPQFRAGRLNASRPPAIGGLARSARTAEPVVRMTDVTSLSPAEGDIIGPSHTFEVVVATDAKIRSVRAYVGRNGSFQSFGMSRVASSPSSETWQVTISNFSDGSWQWYTRVRDSNRTTVYSDTVNFTVGAAPCDAADPVVSLCRWTGGGAVQSTVGRILFNMGQGQYICSGTAVTDATNGRSIILTAAHCVYDDVAKEFATNVIFIPGQDDGGADTTDNDCFNDPHGCWAVDHGVVDLNWANRTFPNNMAWDYAYYVVSDTGSHSGNGVGGALDAAVGSQAISFSAPALGTSSTAFGYPGDRDPNFMFCRDTLTTIDDIAVSLWNGSCGMEGGSSGGSWLQPEQGGNGPVISVNSWGYVGAPGMAGPFLHNTSASLLFDVAQSSGLGSSGAGVVVDPANPPATTTTTTSPTTTTSTTSTTSTSTTTTTTTSTTTTTVAPSAPTAFDKVSPSNGAQSQNRRSTTLTWTASNVSVYEVCLDTTNNDACDTSWTPIEGTAAVARNMSRRTTYYWQVRATNANGTTDANGGLWFSFRTR